MTANHSVTASFAINSYRLTYSAGANGTINGTAPQTVNFGTNGTLVTAVANPGYHFVSWSDGVLTAARTDLNVTANSSFTAGFAINSYARSYSAGTNGTITGTTTQSVDFGATGTLVTAVANPGYHFVSWSDGVLTPARTDVNVTANLSVTASFAINTYTLTYSAGANGTISGTTPQTVNSWANGTLVTAVANPGYHFVSWSDGVLTPARTELNVTAGIPVTASFAINSYTLTYTAGANGTITGTTPQAVNFGASGTLVTAVANSGYHLVSWSDGFQSAARTDVNVTANLSVTASFAINSYTLTFSPDANGSLTGSTSQVVTYSDSASTVTALPNAGYHFANWTGTGGYVTSTANQLTVTNVMATQAITANFALVDGILTPAQGKTLPDISDALRVLLIATGQTTATANDLIHADIAPLGMDNKPKGDGKIDIFDVIGIMRMVLGII